MVGVEMKRPVRKTPGIDPCVLPPRRRRKTASPGVCQHRRRGGYSHHCADCLAYLGPVPGQGPGPCLHEAWEDNGSSRRCADCKEYLGPVPEPAAYTDIPPPPALPPPFRHRMPAERKSVTHKFDLAGAEGYLTVGLFEDGTVGEIFLKMAKQGSTVGGLTDAWATCFSMALQYGVPLERMCSKFTAWSFEPSGFTGNEDVPNAKSVIDYVSRWLMAKYGPKSGGAL